MNDQNKKGKSKKRIIAKLSFLIAGIVYFIAILDLLGTRAHLGNLIAVGTVFICIGSLLAKYAEDEEDPGERLG